MRRILNYILLLAALPLFMALALYAWSDYHDQKNFSAAQNACERGCIQDSGGIDQCRPICAQHPDRYP